MINTDNITFEKAKPYHKKLILSWLEEPHVREFWDNSQAHKDDIINFIHGRKSPSHYANGKYVYWIGSAENIPYCMVMTIEEKIGQKRPPLKDQYLSKSGATYSLDFMIGNTNYLGKGLAALTLISFLKFFKKNFDTQANTFFIDPDITNPRAKHVYEQAGFQYVGEFIMEGSGVFSGRQTHFLIYTINSNNNDI